MNVLSLFDGMSCGQLALKRAGVKCDNYFASEVDEYAIKVTQANHPNTFQLGDVTQWRKWNIDWSSVDLIIGGSPCQGFSFAGKQLAFDDPRSKLFFVFIEILRHVQSLNPNVKFLLENVRMKKEHIQVINDHTGVKPVFINSALVSAQNRQRFYWTNWDFPLPEDRGLVLSDVLEEGVVDREKSYCIDANYYKGGSLKNYLDKKRRQIVLSQSENRLYTIKPVQVNASKKAGGQQSQMHERVFHPYGKSHSLTASCANTTNVAKDSETYRKLTPIECERLQTVPDDYTNHVSNTQRYKMLGNGWTVDVIAHILSFMPIDDLFAAPPSRGRLV